LQLNNVFVDLDRTFIQCNSFSRELKIFFRERGLFKFFSLFFTLREHTRLSIKEFIYSQVGQLNYSECVNESVLELVREFKSHGYKIILVTAAVELSAKRIVAPYKIFDEVIGSKAQINLKGANKLAAIKNRVGSSRFIYIGDSKSDFVIFESASTCVLASNSRLLIFRAKLKFGDKVIVVRRERCQHAS
jgi:phosphoserine phosphatase